MTKALLTLFLLFTLSALSAQTLKELEQRKLKTEKELELTAKLLSQTEQKRVESLNQLNVLKAQISLRKKLIDDIQSKIILYENEIDNKTLFIAGLNQDLYNLKKEYAKLVRFAQRNRTEMHILIFIFASNDFNQAYRRLRFYQQFIRFREKQANDIQSTKLQIENEIQQLNDSKKQLENSRMQKSTEIGNLNSEEYKYQQSVVKLRKKEKELKKEVEDRKNAMLALDKAIKDLIEEEAKKVLKDKSSTVRDGRYLKLSEGFNGNKGKLPWPTPNGIIVSDFGEHAHPVLKGVKIRNNGVDISTEPDEPIKAIFDGEVVKVVSIPGQNVAVILRHGDFLSVYSNLINVSVKVGDTIKLGQSIGVAYTDSKNAKGIFNLQIWKENKNQNPKEWILP